MRTVYRHLSPLLLLSLAACASRTLYQPYGNRGGYSDQELANGLRVARFSGNAFTSPPDAEGLSQFRAFEVCQERGFKIARIFGVFNFSQSQTVQRSSTAAYQTPLELNGNVASQTTYNPMGSNTNSTFNGQITGGNTYGNTTTWNETRNYPTFETVYRCANTAYMAKLSLDPLTPEQTAEFVKDRMGGIQVKGFLPDSPNVGVLKVGDIILSINGDRVANSIQIASAIDANANSRIFAELVRDGKRKKVELKAVDATDFYQQAADRIFAHACTGIPELKKSTTCFGRAPASSR